MDVRSEGQSEMMQGDADAPHDGHDDELDDQAFGLKYPSYSWHETLSRFPALVRLYPLAASSDCVVDEDVHDGQENPTSPGVEFDPGTAPFEGDEEYLNSEPTPAAGRAGAGAPGEPGTATQPDGALWLPQAWDARLLENPSANAGQPAHSVVADSEPVYDGRDSRIGGHDVATGSPPCTARGVGLQATPRSATSRGTGLRGWPEDASAEVEDARRRLDQRERLLAQREAAVRRAEERNRAAARQLSELRDRLDDYGEELEAGVVALTAQQDALEEDRRRTHELQARARRMCAARDEAEASKLRAWDRRSWVAPSGAGI